MTYTISMDGTTTNDELRAWGTFLSGEDELRGRIEYVEAPLTPNHLGTVTDAITVAVGSAGALTILARAVVAFVQSRRSDHSIHMSRPDGGDIRVEAKRIKSANASQIRELVEQLAAELRSNVTVSDKDS